MVLDVTTLNTEDMVLQHKWSLGVNSVSNRFYTITHVEPMQPSTYQRRTCSSKRYIDLKIQEMCEYKKSFSGVKSFVTEFSSFFSVGHHIPVCSHAKVKMKPLHVTFMLHVTNRDQFYSES